MIASHARRDPNPARARTFWTRSRPSSDGRALPDVVGLLGHLDGVVSEAQPALEGLDDAGVGNEVAERGQVVE